MSVPSTAATNITVVTPDTFVAAVTEKWRAINKKTALKPGPTVSGLENCFTLTCNPAWPGTGDVATIVDTVPLVTIEGMPPSEYPKFLVPLAAYTVTEMILQQPELCIARASVELSRLAALVVAARAGAWAALGAVPIHSPNASSNVLRWSKSNSTIVVRAGKTGDGSALWRHFLATAQGFPECTPEMMRAVCGTGPLLFMLGGSLYTKSGEVYAMHYVERALIEHLAATMSKSAQSALRATSQTTMNVLVAAAVGGFRASVIRQVCDDIGFITSAQMLISGDDRAALQIRLDRALAQCSRTQSGVVPNKSALPAESVTKVRVEYAESVVDSEIDGPTSDIANLADFDGDDVAVFDESGAATPTQTRPTPLMTQENATVIRNISQNMRENARKAPSEYNFLALDETARF